MSGILFFEKYEELKKDLKSKVNKYSLSSPEVVKVSKEMDEFVLLIMKYFEKKKRS
jgi:hypothetical protein